MSEHPTKKWILSDGRQTVWLLSGEHPDSDLDGERVIQVQEKTKWWFLKDFRLELALEVVRNHRWTANEETPAGS